MLVSCFAQSGHLHPLVPIARALPDVRAVAKRIRSQAACEVIDGGTVTTLGAAADRIAGELSPPKKAPA